MEKQITLKLIFNRKNKLRKDGKALIQLRIHYIGQKRTEYRSTGIYIKPSEWNESIQQVNSKCRDKYSINQRLTNILSKYNDIEYHANYHAKTLTPESLKAAEVKDYTTMATFYAKWIEETKSFKPNTIKNHNATLNHFINCFGDLSFNEFDRSNLVAFQGYLLECGAVNNTVSKNIKNLKAAYNEALLRKLVDSEIEPFKGYKPLKNEPTTEFLTIKEVALIRDMKIAKNAPGRERVRDMFLFQCYVGLRYSDVADLSDQNFYIEDGNVWIRFNSVKTGKIAKFNLNLLFNLSNGRSEPEKLYFKYENEWQNKPFKISNQKANEHLAIIEKLSGNHKHITTHVARHTFGTYTIRILPINVVQTLMQHSSVTTTMKYCKITPDILNEGLESAKGKWIL